MSPADPEDVMSNPALKSLEAKLTALVEHHRELKERYQQAQDEIGRLKTSLPVAPGGAATEESADLQQKIDLLLKEREDVRQKVENMIKALEDFEE